MEDDPDMKYWILININTNRVVAKFSGYKEPTALRNEIAKSYKIPVLIYDVSPSEYNETRIGEML